MGHRPEPSDVSITDSQKQVLELYNAALALYKERRWQDARAGFQKALDVDAEDGPSKLYLERCDEYLKNPPGEDWDGVFVMTTNARTSWFTFPPRIHTMARQKEGLAARGTEEGAVSTVLGEETSFH